jgi:DNA invertase Pin-like site-specific DNA recombinase
MAAVAQPVEHLLVVQRVAGSIPVGRPNTFIYESYRNLSAALQEVRKGKEMTPCERDSMRELSAEVEHYRNKLEVTQRQLDDEINSKDAAEEHLKDCIVLLDLFSTVAKAERNARNSRIPWRVETMTIHLKEHWLKPYLETEKEQKERINRLDKEADR